MLHDLKTRKKSDIENQVREIDMRRENTTGSLRGRAEYLTEIFRSSIFHFFFL